jgi:hypothetical protein
MDALDLSMDENPSVIAFAILSNYIPPPSFASGGRESPKCGSPAEYRVRTILLLPSVIIAARFYGITD